jgi:hypothetical protein
LFGDIFPDGVGFRYEGRVTEEVHQYPVLEGPEEAGFGPVMMDVGDIGRTEVMGGDRGVGGLADELVADGDLEEAAGIDGVDVDVAGSPVEIMEGLEGAVVPGADIFIGRQFLYVEPGPEEVGGARVGDAGDIYVGGAGSGAADEGVAAVDLG